MAKSPVQLLVDGFKDRDVTFVTYTFEQATDNEGQMTGIPRGGKITVRVKALNDGNAELLNWMLQKSMKKNGKISFENTAEEQNMKEVEFTGAYCVNYTEHWEDRETSGGLGHYEEITITCKTIKVGSVEYANDWA